ncbi:MAG: DNA mismatch repair protein MutS [Sphingomonadaceae bacterium]|uniref:DNA mismatch repair protein MutS n=1 Tax=Thermaurantiacus sp. TaxID=2820283 RepID=UPI00298F2E9A|nr:DNA mismatch repair protein MutS [Thermaurantiacus sp.]MCS6987229.1 DNA mismatch repair protein MutS [Sphingomonadaceae bacterium]MDW8414449.1 DNA mismatch repair protein MutS [Thermaurantiacus sp.]
MGSAIVPAPASRATPMMAQVLALKAEAGDALLLVRMGDFYEAFFEDAAEVARLLDIALTARGEHEGRPVPMCGIPVHAHESYLARLVKAGRAVAIAEQMEDPAAARARGSKAIVERRIVRVLTPGTLTEERLLEGRCANWLAAAVVTPQGAGLAWADVSTGEFVAADLPAETLPDELARLGPAELLVPEGSGMDGTPRPRDQFDSERARQRLCARFGPAAADGFGRPALAAMGALLAHVEATARAAPIRLEPPARHLPGDVLAMDAATRAGLELLRAADGGRDGSALATIDLCVTAAGSRLLAEELAAPLTSRAAIEARLDLVEAFVAAPDLRAAVRRSLKACPDLARALARVAARRGRPGDLAAVRAALAVAQDLGRHLAAARLPGPDLAASLTPPAGLASTLAALADRPPAERGEPGVIRDGADPELDELRRLATDGRRRMAELEARLAAETGVPNLKVRFNAVLGWFVEVPARHAAALAARGFAHRQTLGQAMRFDTPEVRALAQAIATADARARARELALVDALEEAVRQAADPLARLARTLARLDRSAALAEVAATRSWVRPQLTDGRDFTVRAGRHPAVEEALRRTGQAFVPNDCRLEDPGRCWLVTGPNMGGKSTFLRQNALIAILAQAGSFVPAAFARIGIVDRLFSRVGASDALARGRSTFMVEMVETAAILRQATPASLVLMDEVGRGTATWDGLAIAWAVLEAVHDRGCRTLFATHYHELNALAGRLPSLALRSTAVAQGPGGPVFLHQVVEGPAAGSFGLAVARLAGVPAAVVARAARILERLERSEASRAAAEALEALPLFAAAVAPPPPPDVLRARLARVNPDDLTPRAALDLVYELKRLAAED